MVKRIKKLAEEQAAAAAGAASNLFDNHMAAAVRESAQQIWLAGMGAFARAQEGGSKVFEGLMKEGVSLQRRTQAAAEDKIGEVTGKVSAMAEDVQNRAGQHWDKLEGIFEQRTARALGRLGVPTAQDVATLAARVDELAAAVARLAPATAPATAKKASTKAAAPKPASKAVATKKAAAPAGKAAKPKAAKPKA